MNIALRKIITAFLAAVILMSVLLTFCITSLNSDEQTASPPSGNHVTFTDKKSHVFHSGELRGVWIPYFSLSCGDNMTEDTFKRNFDKIITICRSHGANTVFVQVRPNCDAAYPSEIFPFSDFYKISGKAPDYDPLAYMVSAAHRSGLEFHAWINPYRISSSKTIVPEDSPCKKWEYDDSKVIKYNGGLYMNPGSAEVRSLVIAGVKELAENYDIDGVHMDDYFYAFTESQYDKVGYDAYLESVSSGSEALSLEKWRCANVNTLISGIYKTVKSVDNDMLIGISPQGNPDNDITLGADVYSWCSQKGYIDYIAPQIYFNSDNPVCPYENTVRLWDEMITEKGVKLYIGLALYKAGSDEDDGTWLTADNIIASQIKYSRTAGADGYILYSFDYLENEQTSSEMANYDELISTRR